MAQTGKEDAGEPGKELDEWETERLGKLELERRELVDKLLGLAGADPTRMGTTAKAAGLQARQWSVRSAIAEIEGDEGLARSCSQMAQKWSEAHYRARKSDADDVLDAMEEALRTRKLVA